MLQPLSPSSQSIPPYSGIKLICLVEADSWKAISVIFTVFWILLVASDPSSLKDSWPGGPEEGDPELWLAGSAFLVWDYNCMHFCMWVGDWTEGSHLHGKHLLCEPSPQPSSSKWWYMGFFSFLVVVCSVLFCFFIVVQIKTPFTILLVKSQEIFIFWTMSYWEHCWIPSTVRFFSESKTLHLALYYYDLAYVLHFYL